MEEARGGVMIRPLPRVWGPGGPGGPPRPTALLGVFWGGLPSFLGVGWGGALNGVITGRSRGLLKPPVLLARLPDSKAALKVIRSILGSRRIEQRQGDIRGYLRSSQASSKSSLSFLSALGKEWCWRGR